MPKILRNNSLRKILITVAVILAISISIYLAITGRHYFSRRSIRVLEHAVAAYGSFSPVAIFSLMFLSILVPPIPIPTPIIEIAAGYIYGFGPAFFLVWISQIISSFAAYGATRLMGRRLWKKILKNPIVMFYRNYLEEHGSMAVFLTRTTMSSPFSIVSFLAGFTHMPFARYAAATVFGTVAESALLTFVGSYIRHARLRLWYIFLLTVALSIIGPIITYLIVKNARGRKRSG